MPAGAGHGTEFASHVTASCASRHPDSEAIAATPAMIGDLWPRAAPGPNAGERGEHEAGKGFLPIETYAGHQQREDGGPFPAIKRFPAGLPPAPTPTKITASRDSSPQANKSFRSSSTTFWAPNRAFRHGLTSQHLRKTAFASAGVAAAIKVERR